MPKKLLITTGPQGSGNHLFARAFSLHPDVKGWDSLVKNYWVPSDEEPFARYWVYPDELEFPEGDYFLANVSVPFFYDGVRQVPKILEVCKKAKELGVEPVVAIIVRDQNINSLQQKRVGGEITLPTALKYFKNILDSEYESHFLDHEAFFLYKEEYMKYCGNLFDFPVTGEGINTFIDKDANHKYVRYVEEYWLDDTIRDGRKPFNKRN